jgi:uncharacterized protein (TIGR02231 family)
MKRIFFILAAAWIFAGTAASAQLPAIDSSIKKVTLFSDSARVTREATTSVDKGVVRLFLGLDTFSIDRDSATATVLGAGQLLGVSVKEIPQVQAPQIPIDTLQKKLDRLLDQRQQLADQKTKLEKQTAFLNSVIDFSKTQLPREIVTRMPKPDELAQTLAFLGREYARIDDQRRKIDAEAKELKKEIDVVKRELDMLRSRRGNERTGIEILFNSSKKQQIRIEAAYVSKNAFWTPVYRATVSDPPKSVTLSMMAKIVQKTGEEWRNVSLTISNAVPLKGGRLPELRPWYIDMPHPLVRQARDADKTTMFGAVKKSKSESENALMEKVAAPQATAIVNRSTLSFEYTVAVPATIASRQEETLLPLFSRSIAGDFYDFCVPRQNPRAYLVCETKADSELLPGPVNIFFAGRYVGQMMLGEMRPGEPFVVGLGVDRGVRVKRVKIRDKAKATYFGKIERSAVLREMAYRITAQNLKEKPVRLKIMDQVPVSMTDRITVSDIRYAPEPKEKNVDEKPGIMRWDFTAAPGKSVTIDISFTVSYPKEIPPPLQ